MARAGDPSFLGEYATPKRHHARAMRGRRFTSERRSTSTRRRGFTSPGGGRTASTPGRPYPGMDLPPRRSDHEDRGEKNAHDSEGERRHRVGRPHRGADRAALGDIPSIVSVLVHDADREDDEERESGQCGDPSRSLFTPSNHGGVVTIGRSTSSRMIAGAIRSQMPLAPRTAFRYLVQPWAGRRSRRRKARKRARSACARAFAMQGYGRRSRDSRFSPVSSGRSLL